MVQFALLLRPAVHHLRVCGALVALLPFASAGLGASSAPPSPGIEAEEKKPARTGGPRLQVAAPNHDFGRVQQGQPVRHDFKFFNAGDAPLEIIDVKPACGCTTAGEWTRMIKPGETGTLPIQLDTTQFAGVVTKTVTVHTNDPTNPPAVLEIKAFVWTPVQISQPVLIFPALTNPDQVISRSVTIRNQVEGKLKVSEPKSDQPSFAPVLKEIVPGQEYELTVTTVPPIPNGTQTARITMKSSNAKMPELSVQAVVTMLPPVQVAPTEIMLPLAKLAAPEKRYVVVLNHRGGDLKVSDLKTNLEGVAISMVATPDGKQFTITLTFPVGFEPLPTGKMIFSGRTNHPDHAAFEVPIVYAGHR